MWTANVSSSWLAGFTVCLSLIVSIGAQNLYVLRQAVQGQHVRACVAWCVVSDVVLIGLGVAGMARLLGDNPDLARYLTLGGALFLLAYGLIALWRMAMAPDRKSTRLNSSHLVISYAVFCLKKKKNNVTAAGM